MPITRSRLKTRSKAGVRKPTEVLLQGREVDNPLAIIEYTREGFGLNEVREMLSESALYMEHDLAPRIMGKSERTLRRMEKETSPVRLNQQQSTVAFQYAQVLEHAVRVFGNQQLAEDWLGKTCKYLDGNVPLELIDHSLGFQVVEDYLTRIEFGVYQ